MTKSADKTNPVLPDWLRGVDPACVEGCDQEVLRIARRSYDSPWPVYQAYMHGVRREFCPAVTSDFEFRIGRRAFLEKVLRQKRIFLTDEMASRLEVRARFNIGREIDSLKAEGGVFGEIVARLLARH